MLRHKLTSACGAVVFLLMVSGSVTHAQPGQNQNGNPQNPGQNGQNFTLSATPELDSAVLFVAGIGGTAIPYLLLRRRARRTKADPET